ncbi:MAG: ribosome biogenesis GTPase Der [Chloroflexi bacterium]|nr:ribosome biogenesis GTPase Der [Chloroflexota bacterium]
MTKPVVAILGRPNVGKSTLFNRIVGQRKAIVEDLPGTTRDRIYGEGVWQDREFSLIDTGGYELQPATDIRRRVKEQVALAIQEADVLLFVVDGQEGVVPADIETAELLRRSGKPVLLAVNKLDNPRKKTDALVFYELGIGDPVPMSAHHGQGTADLLDRMVELLPPSPPPTPGQEVMMKLAIVGRPNVGKSLLLNTLLGKERAIVSEVPGTTRDAIDTVLETVEGKVLLIDTAGIRRAGHIERGVEKYSVMRAMDAVDRCDIALLVTDVEEILPAQDTHIAGYIKKAAKSLIVVVNKWDLAPGVDRDELNAEILDRLKFFPPLPVLFVSALTGEGVDRILPAARQVYAERQKRVPTGLLNGIIKDAVASHPAPTVKGRKLKILYVTQAEVNPPTFVFFINDEKLRHFSYDRYLENKLRAAFGFMGTPLRFIFKARREE